jgi:pimeloyl-ACP methyl ester carboxylesterase
MRDGRRRLRIRRLPALAAGSGGAAVLAAGLAIERRHLRRVARDPDYARLSVPLGGEHRSVRSADGTQLNARIFGPDDAPTLVLVHGWTEALRFWSDVITDLGARGLRLVAYDLRGHGESGRASEGDYSLARFGEDVEAILATCVPPGGRAAVAGHSLGAMSIAAWAEHHDVGLRVCAAALINTGLGDLISGHLLFGEAARWLRHPVAGRMLLGSRAPAPRFSSPLLQAVLRYGAFGPAATIGQVAYYERMLIACPADVRAACGVAMSEMDLHEAVARLTVPTLVVAGACDRLTPPAHARRILATLPQPPGLLVLPDTGHMSPLERPTECSDALYGLVDDCHHRDDPPTARLSSSPALPE